MFPLLVPPPTMIRPPAENVDAVMWPRAVGMSATRVQAFVDGSYRSTRFWLPWLSLPPAWPPIA
jgi:hypothetical protein